MCVLHAHARPTRTRTSYMHTHVLHTRTVYTHTHVLHAHARPTGTRTSYTHTHVLHAHARLSCTSMSTHRLVLHAHTHIFHAHTHVLHAHTRPTCATPSALCPGYCWCLMSCWTCWMLPTVCVCRGTYLASRLIRNFPSHPGNHTVHLNHYKNALSDAHCLCP